MALHYIQHCLIRAQNIERSKQFYIDVLELHIGYRPPFDFAGYWLYLENLPVIHLVSQTNTTHAQTDYLGHRNKASGTGSIDHVAFLADNYEKTAAHLKRHNISMRHRIVPEEGNIHQLFIEDPDGILIELNFANII